MGWATIYANGDIPGLRNAATQVISNTDSRQYITLQAARSTRSTFTLKQRKSESANDFYERCMTAFQAHSEAGHGWPVDAHYKEAVAALAVSPDHDRTRWTGGEPPADEEEALYDDCIEALKAVIFLEGLTEKYKEYNDRLANAFAENNDIYPKRTPTAKERIARHKPSTAAPPAATYSGDPIGLSFATHSLQGTTPYFNADGTFTCFKCGKKGHRAKDCPDNKDTAVTAPCTAAAPASKPAAATAPPAAAPAPAPQGWASGVPLSVTLSAAPPARPASVVSAVTNTTRGTTGGSRLNSNSEILDLLSAAQDNGDGKRDAAGPALRCGRWR